ncbi:hypothetical protein C5F52_13670 [Limnohabitans sp. TS-CS-82]|jgi:hypothetical protein|uniref:hypothetical protein n=1 Tax=Limnohabitans sp. TS-CS-82 TaxID=2094193 RepID=UPI000CF2724E|nr:hypothetical protein [Limnohabitans sp. TS-CS-82]PQA82634.1 hypothetical protein C5F52_13670 [Limnohabitans sp. TS-CS-82]
MELLLIAILALMIYLAINATKGLNVLRRMAGYSDGGLKGKFIQSDILISEKHSASPLYIRREVTQSGLTEILKIGALVEFDSLGVAKYLIGQELEIRCCESFNDGDRDGVVGLLVNRQDFALQGHLNCSEKSFLFICDQLSKGKPLLLRVYGKLLGPAVNGVQVGSDSFEILVDGQLAGPAYFCENYEAYWSKLEATEKEKLEYFNEQFRLRR